MGVTAIRSFFAVPLSPGSEQCLADATGIVRKRVEHSVNAEARLRWIPSRNYHLTLAFLGDIERRDLPVLHDIALQTVADIPATTFSLTAFQWFPSALKPRVLAAVPAPCEPLAALQKSLGRRLGQQGFYLEKRSFRPHVSLARVRGVGCPVDLQSEPLAVVCELDELVLFSSVQERGGSVYSPLIVEPIGL